VRAVKLQTLKNQGVCFPIALHRAIWLPTVSLLIGLSVFSILSSVQVAAQVLPTVNIHFTVQPTTPVANQVIAFSWDASNINGSTGTVGGIVILGGSGCLPDQKIVATVKVDPPLTFGPSHLQGGLPAGDYGAVALLTVVVHSAVTAYEYFASSDCLNFTVTTPVPEFPYSALILLLACASTEFIVKLRIRRKRTLQ